MFLLFFAGVIVSHVLRVVLDGTPFIKDDTLPYLFSWLAAVFAAEVVGKLDSILQAIRENNAK
jgi:hypothetical protein